MKDNFKGLYIEEAPNSDQFFNIIYTTTVNAIKDYDTKTKDKRIVIENSLIKGVGKSSIIEATYFAWMGPKLP
jgi:hypothetical protein